MEWLKNKSLKQSFFAVTALFLSVGLLLSVISFFTCVYIRSRIQQTGTSIEISVGKEGAIISNDADLESARTAGTNVEKTAPDIAEAVLSALQMILPVFFVMLSLILADIVFYRLKLKKPLEILELSAARISRQDLDFTVESPGNDELGRLCSSFETMRAELLETNRVLWRQVEERRRLNAAFAHDLRNPVTVLKGSAKLLGDGLKKGSLNDENAADIVALITQYAGRIETYVSAMTSAQKLEELECRPCAVDWNELKESLKNSLMVLCHGSGIVLKFQAADAQCSVNADRAILFNVAENLVYNALRYAKSTVNVTLTLENSKIILCISDDGPGFSEFMLKKGAAPFIRDTASPSPNTDNSSPGKNSPPGCSTNDNGNEHFGMGLYVCRLLCKKHHGNLQIKNSDSGGAVVTAEFNKS